MRSRRGLRTQREPDVSSGKEDAGLAPAPLSLEVQRPWRVTAPRDDSFELGRAFPCALGSAHGRRGRDASDRLLHSETFQLEHPCQSPFPSAAILLPRDAPHGAPPGDHSRTEPRGSCSFTRNVSFRVLPHSPRARERVKMREAGTGQLGSPDANEAGGNRGSQRDSHFDGRASALRGRCLPSIAIAVTVSDTSVASSSLSTRGRVFATSRLGSKAAKTGSAGAL